MQIVLAGSLEKGLERTKEILYETIDARTVLFLSGGKTPASLYHTLATEERIHPAAVALIDERYGPPMHENSNERLLQESGLLRYFHLIDVPFYSMLRVQDGKKEAALAYDEIIRDLFFNFPKSVGLFGIGSDGHTAGIPRSTEETQQEKKNLYQTSDLVASHDNEIKGIGNRITLTFTAITMMDKVIIAAFGEDKKDALGKLFEPGPIENCPARFFNTPEMTKKAILITDQKI